MKKVFYFSLMVMTMFLMTACSSSGPGDAMKSMVIISSKVTMRNL